MKPKELMIMLSLMLTVHSERLGVCPGGTVNYVCTNRQSHFIDWTISCHTSTDEMSCRTSTDRVSVNAITSPQSGTTCDAIEFLSTFMLGESNLTITLPHTATHYDHLEISCAVDNNCRYLYIAGVPSPPENFTHITNYSSTSDTEVTVTMVWSSGDPDLNGVDIEYTLLLTNHNSLTSHTTSNSNWTTSLHYNQTYFITLYSTTCGGTFISDNFTTNITIKELPSSCPPPVLPAGVELTTIVNGSVIAYQCGEGLVPEGRVEALCGADGNWRPPPENLTCSIINSDVMSPVTPTSSDVISPGTVGNVNTHTSSGAVQTSEDTMTTSPECSSLSLPVSVGVTAVATLLVGLSAGLTLGVVIGWIARSRKQPSTCTPDVPPAGGESEVAGLAPVYEEIGLEETQDIHLKGNAAYGYKI